MDGAVPGRGAGGKAGGGVKERPIDLRAADVRAVLDSGTTRLRLTRCPYRTGDRLWVRETVATGYGAVFYKADDDLATCGMVVPWRRSSHMPRYLSRLTVEVAGVRGKRGAWFVDLRRAMTYQPVTLPVFLSRPQRIALSLYKRLLSRWSATRLHQLEQLLVIAYERGRTGAQQ